MYFQTPTQAISMLSAFLVCGYALWRGGIPERIASAVLFADWLVTPIIDVNSDLMHIHIGVFAFDAILGIVLLFLALKSDRYWPLWMTGFQGFELLMHVAMLIDPKVHARAYFIGLEIGSYLVLTALAVGVWLEAPRGKAWFQSIHKAVSTAPKP